MAELPSGTVTFLFTDIEGSTARWEEPARGDARRARPPRRADPSGHRRARRPHRQDDGRRRSTPCSPRPGRRRGGAGLPSAGSRPSRGARSAPAPGADGAAHRRGRGAGRRLLRPAAESGGPAAGDRATAARCCSPRRRPRWSATPCPTGVDLLDLGRASPQGPDRARARLPARRARTCRPTSRPWPRSTPAATTCRPTRPPLLGRERELADAAPAARATAPGS